MKKSANLLPVNRCFKSQLFVMLFEDKKKLLELYNAVTGKNYQDPEELTINTLENAIYMSMKNDLSFIIDLPLSLYEHQSTYSPNLPLRFLMYISDIYSEITREENLYGTRLIPIPTPQFVVFYNGEQEQPERWVLKLSDAYMVKEEEVSLEVKVLMLNINKGHNEGLLSACKTLREYAEYVFRVRKKAKEMELEEAVEQAITECIREGILAEFLKKNRAEAKSVSIYEYDMEKHMRMERAEAREEGIKEGMEKGLQEGRTKLLQEMIQKKYRKGKSAEEIAEELEITEDTVKKFLDGVV
ncbi:MAG: hypothetical protein Q4C97_06650 [Bacillota bacterium]|nr:hypothetical protein [Bacillota bacterium]